MGENVEEGLKWLRLMRRHCTRVCPAMESVLDRVGLNLPQFNAVSILGEKGELTMGELSKELGVTMGAGTNLMDKLVEAGLAGRLRTESDRRVVRVSLTPKGTDALDRASRDIARFWSEVVGGLDPAERTQFLASYQKMIGFLEEARKRFRAET